MIPQLELFGKKPVQACITGRMTEILKPLSALPSIPDVIEFASPGRPLHYLDINNLMLRVIVHMRKKASKANLLATDENNSVADCTLHSLFSAAEVFLSEKSVTKSPDLYGYKSVFDLYSTASASALKTSLATIPVEPDDHPADFANNAAGRKREKPFLTSKAVELYGKLRADICDVHGGLYLLDNVPLRVRLTVQKQDFFLWTSAQDPDIELVFDRVELEATYFVGNTELAMGLDAAVQEHPATYHFKSSQIKTFIHPPGSVNISIPVAFSGKLPTTLFYSMVAAENFNGHIKKNPYCFDHFKIEELSFTCNGVERKYNVNLENSMHCSTALRSIYRELNNQSEDDARGCYTVDAMSNGRFACAVDLTIDHTGRGPSQNLDLHGVVSVQARLKTALNHAIVVLLYAQFDSVMEISASREVNVY
jgi:hypothetical protein